MTGRRAIRFLAALLLLFSGGCGQGRANRQAPFRLQLKLAHSQLRHGEKLWYRLQITNVSDLTLTIDDRFWCEQTQLIANSKPGYGGTYFKVVNEKGKTEEITINHGFHGELRFWENEPTGQCGKEPPELKLKPGETFAASPSVIAPLRTSPDVVETIDFRANPPIPSHVTGERRQRLAEEWREMVERMHLYSTPLPGGRLGPVPDSIPLGYRVLEGYELLPPGRYKINAVFEAEPRRLIKEEIRARGHFNPADFGWPTDMQVFRFQSNTVVFEILP